MIKLTIKTKSDSEVRVFDKHDIVIGSLDSADLQLDDEQLQEVHVTIEEIDGEFIIINRANDPFVLLNGLPFWKGYLKNGAELQIGKTPLLFETSTKEDLTLSQEEDYPAEEDPFDPVFGSFVSDSEMEAELRKIDEQAFKEEIGENEKEKVEEIDVEALMKQVEELEVTPPSPIWEKIESDSKSPEQAAAPAEEETLYCENEERTDPSISAASTVIGTEKLLQSQRTLKDLYFQDSDEENERSEKDKERKKPEEVSYSRWNWKFIFACILGMFFVLGTGAGGMYFSMTDRSDEEEAKAVDSIADVAMALSYAHIKHLKPQNRNWADPDFLKNNLSGVLGDGYSPTFCLDNNGQFGNCPYILRIYTSNDQSHFLVIAQPAPGLSQWLIPKIAIVVDSSTMEIRKIDDLKILNRLLVNPNALEGTNAIEISNLVNQGGLVPLATLAGKGNKTGFNMPKALALLQPGAENRIYNAPRYHHLGEEFMRQAVSLLDTPSGSREVEMLQNEIMALARFPNLVLYTSQGMQWAIKSQKALNTFVPNTKFMVAYLNYNSKGGLISSHLLMDEGLGEIAYEDQKETSFPALSNVEPLEESSSTAKEEPAESEETANLNHPFYLRVQAQKAARQKAIKPISDEIISLLSAENGGYVPLFSKKIEDLLVKYLDAVNKADAKMLAKLHSLYKEYQSTPLSEIVSYVQAAGFEGLVEGHLEEYAKDSERQADSETRIEGILLNIQNSKTLEELDENLKEGISVLNLENVPSTQKLIDYQNQTRGIVLKKLEEFFFSPQTELPKSSFQAENKPLISAILRNAWITDQEEKDYYLNEFDDLVKKNGSSA